MTLADTPAVYIDSSILVASLVPGETHHRKALELLAACLGQSFTSVVSEVEVFRALARRGGPSAVVKAAQRLLAECFLLDLTEGIRSRAGEIPPASMRSLDAIHVASAIVCGISNFATLDERQAVGATEANLRVLDL
ncbi:MAG: type II toxin-antitoxin system VapC family toxin [Actinomycetota bacterium]